MEQHSGVYTDLQRAANSFQVLVVSSCPGKRGDWWEKLRPCCSGKHTSSSIQVSFPHPWQAVCIIRAGIPSWIRGHLCPWGTHKSCNQPSSVHIHALQACVSHSTAAQADLRPVLECSPHKPALRQMLCSNHWAAPPSCSWRDLGGGLQNPGPCIASLLLWQSTSLFISTSTEHLYFGCKMRQSWGKSVL